jgi:hypothetical protein
VASEVSIRVVIDDAGVSETLGRVDAALGQVGVQGTASVKQLGQEMETLHGHTTTNLDSVRLLSQEFGLRLPRALESMLSRMTGFTTLLSGATGALAGFAFAEVFYRGADAIYQAEQRYVSITSAADKYYETLKKTSELDFTNVRDAETAQSRLGQSQGVNSSSVTDAARSLQHSALGQLLMGNLVGAAADSGAANSVGDSQAQAAQRIVEISRKKLDLDHEDALQQIEINHAADANLEQRRQITAEVAKQVAVNKENREYSRKLEATYGNVTPTDAGAGQEANANRIAATAAATKEANLNSAEALALLRARNQAEETGERGEALYEQKRKDAIAELVRQLENQHEGETINARVSALNLEYAKERVARARELTEETQRQHEAVAGAGLTGAARIHAEGDAQLAGVNQRQTKFSGCAPISTEAQGDFDQQRADVAAATQQRLTELDKTFTASTKDLINQRTSAQLGAYARIEAATQEALDKQKKLYTETYGASGGNAGQAAQEATAEAAIRADGDRQLSEARTRNTEEDERYAREAAQAESRVRQQGVAGWVSAYRNGIAEIRALEEQRIEKMEDDARKEGATEEEIQKRKQDIVAAANAQIAQQNEQLQHTIAGQLQEAFSNPMDYIKRKGQQMMFEMIADWLLQLKTFHSIFGSTLTPGQPGAGTGPGAGGGIAGMLGSAAGHAFGINAPVNAPTGTAGVISAGTMLPASYGGSGGGSGASGGSGGGAGVAATLSSAASQSFGLNSPMYAPTGTAGVISAGTMLPASYGGAGGGSGALGAGGAVGYSGTATSSSAAVSSGANYSGTIAAAQPLAQANIAGTVSSVIGDASSLYRQFGGTTNSSAASGTTGASTIGTPPSLLSGAMSGDIGSMVGLAGAGMAAYSGTEGVLSSFHTAGAKGVLDGTMSGAGAGAAIGSIIPGLGTVLGGAIGAGVGLVTSTIGAALDEGNKFAARDYYKQTLFPELEDVRKNFNSSTNYLDAISEANKDAGDGLLFIHHKYGGEAADWINDNYLAKELAYVTSTIERGARGNSADSGRQATQFHDGGLISDFGSLGTSSTEGYIHALMGEGIVNQPAMAMHGAGVGMMNRGASPADMASHYLQVAGGGSSIGTGGGSMHFHTHNYNALDAKSFGRYLDTGGMEQINKSANRRAALYAGDSVG